MIVVCNNTTVSKMVYRWIAGYEIETETRIAVEKGNLPIFRNENGVQMLERPNTLIVDSAQLESGESRLLHSAKTVSMLTGLYDEAGRTSTTYTLQPGPPAD